MNKAEKYKETIEAILCSNVLTVSGKTEAILDLLTDFAKKEKENILFEFIDWFDKYVAPYGKRRHVKKFLHFYNQKFKEDESNS